MLVQARQLPLRGLDRENGVSMVELAILMPILTVILFGILQFGLLFAGYLTIQNAAVVCVRFAALSNQNASASDLEALARDSIVPMLEPANLRPPVIDMNSTIGGVGGAKRVELTYDMPLLFPFLVPQAGGQLVFPIHATAVMR